MRAYYTSRTNKQEARKRPYRCLEMGEMAFGQTVSSQRQYGEDAPMISFTQNPGHCEKIQCSIIRKAGHCCGAITATNVATQCTKHIGPLPTKGMLSSKPWTAVQTSGRMLTMGRGNRQNTSFETTIKATGNALAPHTKTQDSHEPPKSTQKKNAQFMAIYVL